MEGVGYVVRAGAMEGGRVVNLKVLTQRESSWVKSVSMHVFWEAVSRHGRGRDDAYFVVFLCALYDVCLLSGKKTLCMVRVS